MKFEVTPIELKELLSGLEPAPKMRYVGNLVLLPNGADLFVPEGVRIDGNSDIPAGCPVIPVYAKTSDLLSESR